MGNPVRAVKRSDVVRRRIVDQATILGPDEHVRTDIEVRAAAVDERRAGLGAGAGEILGIEDHPAGSG